MKEVNAILAIATRDLAKFLRDRPRIGATFVFPIVFIGVLGGSLQANLGDDIGYSFLVFIFTGILGQTMFQSSASGVISLIQDRESDFSQEMFVAPVSRYSIILGKILGESLVALVQGIGIIIFGLIIHVPLSLSLIFALIPFLFIASVLGGAFGILVLSNLSSQRSANQIFPFIIFPQFVLAGVFSPIQELPPLLLILSRAVPMTYAVDLVRSIYYAGSPVADQVVLFSPAFNLLVIAGFFLVFLFLGTFLFIRGERNK